MGARSSRAVRAMRVTGRLIACNPRRNRAQGCRVLSPFRISGHLNSNWRKPVEEAVGAKTSIYRRRRRADSGSLAPRLAMADVPTPFTFDMAPPMDNREKFIAWGVAQRGEDPNISASDLIDSARWFATKTSPSIATNTPSF